MLTDERTTVDARDVRGWLDALLADHRPRAGVVGDEAVIATFLRPIAYLARPLPSGPVTC